MPRGWWQILSCAALPPAYYHTFLTHTVPHFTFSSTLSCKCSSWNLCLELQDDPIFPSGTAEDSCSYVPLRRIDCDALFRGHEQNFSSSRPQASEASGSVFTTFTIPDDSRYYLNGRIDALPSLASQAAPQRDAAGYGVLPSCRIHGSDCVGRHDV